ncbi:hypothetical protein ACFVFP_10420, partial [Streptomyces sp. NPDC057686]
DRPGPAPVTTTADPQTPVQRAQTRAPLGAPLTELPPTATPPGRPSAASDSAPAPAMPMVQRQTEPAADRPGPAPVTTTADPQTPVQRAQTRAPLGAPLTGLPPTATPPGHPSAASDSAPAPAMPMVQRQTEPAADRPASGQSTPRVRTGLGAPLPALPPSAAVPTSPSSRSRAARPASPADVQRAPAPTNAARPQAPSVHAPLLGAGDVQRRTPATTSAAPTPDGPAGAPPLVQRATATSPDLPTPQSTAPSPARPGTPTRSRRTDGPSPARGTGPVPLVVARPVTDRSGTPHHPRNAAAAPAPRTLQLLAARPLPLGTRDMGSTAAPAPRPASRPVVAAHWAAPSTAPQQVQQASDGPRGTTAPTPARTSASPGHGPRPVHAVRPAPTSAAPARVAATALPVTGPHAPPLVVQPSVVAASSAQPVPVVRPRTTAPAVSPAATGTAPPASTPPVQRDTGGSRSTPGPISVQTAAPATRGDRRPATAQGTTAAGRHERSRDAVPQQQGGDLDLDDLARRLLDPVARLLRTELRRGRERAGRPFDGRR